MLDLIVKWQEVVWILASLEKSSMNEIDRNPRIFRILNEDALETHAAVPTAGRAMPEKQQYFLQHIL